MPYQPRNAIELLNSLRAGIIGRSSLTDLNPASALSLILQAVAEEFASVERRLFILREGFYLRGATGTDLDEHVSQLPPIGINRILQTNASAACLRMERDDATNALEIAAGATVATLAGVQYRTIAPVNFAAGQLVVTGIPIVATTAGTAGNCAIGAIRRIVAVNPAIIAVINEQPLTNGTDRETDEQLRSRAVLYLKSLSRCSRTMLEFIGTSFVGVNGDRFSYARLYEDPAQPGYSELVVDDGSGIVEDAVSKLGLTSVTNITVAGQPVAFHDAPATAPILPESFIVWRNGDPTQQISVGRYDYTSIPERGIVYFNEGVLQPGDRVFIQNYRVFTGLIAELQREIEGDPNNFDRLTGFRAAGTRVLVRPVRPEFVTLDVSLLVSTSAQYAAVENRLLVALETAINSLQPGQQLYISQLVEVARSVSGVKDVHFYEAGTTNAAPNVYPSSARSALRVRRAGLTISSAAN